MDKKLTHSSSQELRDIRESGTKFFRNIVVDESNILYWQGVIVPVRHVTLLSVWNN